MSPDKVSDSAQRKISRGAAKALTWAKRAPSQLVAAAKLRLGKVKERTAKKSKTSDKKSAPTREQRPWSELSKAEKKLARRTPIRTLWWWLSLTVFTSSGGFLFPAIALAFSVTEGWTTQRQLTVVIAAGAVQGLLVGGGQVIALRRGPLRIPIIGWLIVTTLGFAFGWAVALVPGSVFRPAGQDISVIVGVIALVLLVILIVPIVQSLLLMRRVRDAWRWILIMGISAALGSGSFLYAIVLVQGKSTFIGTILPFIYMGWAGIMLYSLVSALGVFWMAREAYTDSETRALIARQRSNERKARRAIGTGIVFVGTKTVPALRTAARKVAGVVGAATKNTGPASSALARRVAARTSAVAKGMRRQTPGSTAAGNLTAQTASALERKKPKKKPTKKVVKKKAQKAPEKT